MNIIKKQTGTTMEITLDDRLDSTTAPELEKEIKDQLSSITELTVDFGGVEYISSAGIRVMLMAYRGLHHGGTMKVKNANELVREVFEVTGFSDFVTLD